MVFFADNRSNEADFLSSRIRLLLLSNGRDRVKFTVVSLQEKCSLLRDYNGKGTFPRTECGLSEASSVLQSMCYRVEVTVVYLL